MAKSETRFRILGEDATALAFRSALGRAEDTATRMKSIFVGAFAGISVAAFGRFAMQAIQTGDELQKMAVKAGIGGKAISELAHAAKMSDVDLSGLANSLRFMQINLSQAETGSKSVKLAFDALGLSIGRLKGLKADQQFELIAERISLLTSAEDKARAATEIFGRAGADLLPMFEQGAEGIRKAREEAQKLGVSFSDEQLKKLADADDAIKRLSASWQGFATTMTSAVAPAIADVLDLLSGNASIRRSGYAGDMTKAQIIQELRHGIAIKSANRDFNSPEMNAIIDQQIAEMEAKIARLETGERGGANARRGQTNRRPVGFAAADAAAEAAEKAAKARVEAEKDAAKERAEVWQRERNEFLSIQEGMQDDIDQALKDGADSAALMFENATEAINAYGEAWAEHNEEMIRIAEERDAQIKGIFEEGVFRAWEDGLDGMLKYWSDTLKQMAIQAAATELFNLGGGGVGKFFSGLFGGFRAKAGPIEQGKWYIAGEHGPEPIWGGGPGAMAMGYGKSGSQVVQHISIDARGSSVESVKLMQATVPAIIRQAVQQARIAVMDDLSRGVRA